MKRRRSTKVPRAKIEQARNAAALEAMFFWQLAEREGSQKWQRKADALARAAVRLDAELNGDEGKEPHPHG
jgi:hypothetical protein